MGLSNALLRTKGQKRTEGDHWPLLNFETFAWYYFSSMSQSLGNKCNLQSNMPSFAQDSLAPLRTSYKLGLLTFEFSHLFSVDSNGLRGDSWGRKAVQHLCARQVTSREPLDKSTPSWDKKSLLKLKVTQTTLGQETFFSPLPSARSRLIKVSRG